MDKIKIDELLRSKLNGAAKQVELCDAAGKTLGFFIPVNDDSTDDPGVDISIEEADRRCREPGRTLEEIRKSLGVV